MAFRFSVSVPSSALLLVSRLAHACTTCDSVTAHQVRSGIFDGHFLQTAALVSLPFPVFAVIILALRFASPVAAQAEDGSAL